MYVHIYIYIYHLNVTNFIICLPQLLLEIWQHRPRTLSSKRHELYHLNDTKFIIQMPRTQSKRHQLHHLNVTNSIISRSRTLSSKCHEHQPATVAPRNPRGVHSGLPLPRQPLDRDASLPLSWDQTWTCSHPPPRRILAFARLLHLCIGMYVCIHIRVYICIYM